MIAAAICKLADSVKEEDRGVDKLEVCIVFSLCTHTRVRIVIKKTKMFLSIIDAIFTGLVPGLQHIKY